jgi:predicted RNA-binding Zn-ribbon protein involved in translation (DUF1610 family)
MIIRSILEELKDLLTHIGEAADKALEIEEDVDGLEKISSAIIHAYERLASRINAMEEEQKETCPDCGGPADDSCTLSRKDNKTEICNDCGMAEAFEELSK